MSATDDKQMNINILGDNRQDSKNAFKVEVTKVAGKEDGSERNPDISNKDSIDSSADGTVSGANLNGHPPKACRYQSKRCDNARAYKKNGQLHNLCEFHRVKANSNQRKLDRKKRREAKVSPYLKRDRFGHTVPPRLSGYPFPHMSTGMGEPRYTDLSTDDFQFLVQCFASAGEQQMHQQHHPNGDHESLQSLLFDRTAAVNAYEREKISPPREGRYIEGHPLDSRYTDERHMQHRMNMESRHMEPQRQHIDSRNLDARHSTDRPLHQPPGAGDENWRSLPPFGHPMPMAGHAMSTHPNIYPNPLSNYVSFEQWSDHHHNDEHSEGVHESGRNPPMQYPVEVVHPKN